MSIILIWNQRPEGWDQRELIEKVFAYGRGDEVEFSDFDFQALTIDRALNDLWIEQMHERGKVDPLILTLGREEGAKARAEVGRPWMVPA